MHILFVMAWCRAKKFARQRCSKYLMIYVDGIVFDGISFNCLSIAHVCLTFSIIICNTVRQVAT